MRALQRLGAEHAVVVHGRDGLDEVSLGAATMVGELKDGEIREYDIHPEDFGLAMAGTRALKVASADDSLAMLRGGARRHARAGARHRRRSTPASRCYAAGVAPTMGEGVERARRAVACGAARAKLDEFVARAQALQGQAS